MVLRALREKKETGLERENEKNDRGMCEYKWYQFMELHLHLLLLNKNFDSPSLEMGIFYKIEILLWIL